MTLLDMQRALSRILTNPSFRQAFQAGDPTPGFSCQLNPSELQRLRALRWDLVTRYAEGIAHGRFEAALEPTPRTRRLLHEQLRDRRDQFCLEYPPLPRGEDLVLVEMARMGKFILGLFGEGHLTPDYAREVLIYEKTVAILGKGYTAWESASRVAGMNAGQDVSPSRDVSDLVPVSGPHAAVESFRYDLPDLIRRLDSGEIPGHAEPLAQPLLLLFVKQPGIPRIQTVKLNTATAALLSAVDGRRTLAEIFSSLAGAPGRAGPGDRAGLAAAGPLLRQLRKRGVIAFQAPGAAAAGEIVRAGTGAGFGHGL